MISTLLHLQPPLMRAFLATIPAHTHTHTHPCRVPAGCNTPSYVNKQDSLGYTALMHSVQQPDSDTRKSQREYLCFEYLLNTLKTQVGHVDHEGGWMHPNCPPL